MEIENNYPVSSNNKTKIVVVILAIIILALIAVFIYLGFKTSKEVEIVQEPQQEEEQVAKEKSIQDIVDQDLTAPQGPKGVSKDTLGNISAKQYSKPSQAVLDSLTAP